LSHLAPPPFLLDQSQSRKPSPCPPIGGRIAGEAHVQAPAPHWSFSSFPAVTGSRRVVIVLSQNSVYIYISRMKRQRHPTMMDHLAGQATPAIKVPRLVLSGRQEVLASPSRSLKGEFLTPSSNTFSYKESPLARGCRSVGKMLRRRMRLSRKLSGGSMVSSNSSNSSNSSSNSSSSSSNSSTEQQQLEIQQQPPAAHRQQQEPQQLPVSCGKSPATSFLISAPTAHQQQTYHHSQQFLPRALPNDNDIIRRATTMTMNAATATEQQLLLLRRSRRRTMVRTNGSLPASGRHHSFYFGGEEEIGELVLPPMLRALPVIPFWGEEEERPVRPPRRRKEEEMRRKEEEEEEKAMRTESLDSLIAQAQAQLQEERAASRLAWAPSVKHARRMSAAASPAGATTFVAATPAGATTAAAATPTGGTTCAATPAGATIFAATPIGGTTSAAALAKRRVSEVNQNYMMSSPGGEHSVYMSMQVMTSAKKCRSTSSNNSPSVDVPASLSTHSSEYIDMAAFPLKL
jgi:hypothetical protein